MDEELLSGFDNFTQQSEQPQTVQPQEAKPTENNQTLDIADFDSFVQPQQQSEAQLGANNPIQPQDTIDKHRPENIDDESWVDIKNRVSKFISKYTPVGATFNMVGELAGEAMQKEGSQVAEAVSVKSRVDNIESTYSDLADMVKSATGDKESEQAIKTKQNQMNDEVVGILKDKGIEAYNDNGKLYVVTKDKDGNDVLNDLDDETLDTVLGSFKASAGEIGGALIGAAGGATASQRLVPPTAPIQARATAGAIGALGGGYIGATLGRATDLIRNAISLNKKIDAKEVLEKSLTAGTADIVGTTAIGAIAKAGSKAIEPLKVAGKKVETLLRQGNLGGAKELVKKQYNLTDKNIDDMFKEYTKDSKGYEDLTGDDLLKAKLTVAVQQQPQGAADIIQAIKGSKTAAIETSKEIDARAKEVLHSANKFSKKPSAIKKSIQAYEKAVGKNYAEVRNLIGEALPNYKTNLNLAEFTDTLKDLNTRVIDPQVKEKLDNLTKSLSSQKTENINDLIDTRQLFNKFYGKNSQHFENAKDKASLLSIQKAIDAKIDEALNTLPDNVAKPLKASFEDAKKMYSNMFKTQDTATYNAIFKKGASEADIGQALIKYSKSTDGDLEAVLSKLSPVQRTKSEFSILSQMVKNATFKADAKAINFSKLLEDIGSSKAIFKTPEAKQFLKNIETYDKKFGKDSDFQRVALGIADKEAKNIATTLEGKVKMAAANKYFAAIQRILPTDTAKSLSLQKAIETTLEKSRSPKEFFFKASKIKGMPNADRQNLKRAVKEIADKERTLEAVKNKRLQRKETKNLIENFKKRRKAEKVEAEAKARWEKAVEERKQEVKTKKLNKRAEEIKDLAEPKIGGSEDEAKASVKNALSKNKSNEAKYKNMSKDDIAELDRMEAAQLASEANQLFAKGGDNLAAGTIAGIDEDENGNITFDPEKFVLGLGGYTAVKALARNKTLQKEFKGYINRALDDLERNPKFNYLSGKQNVLSDTDTYIPQSKFSTAKASKEKSYHPLKRTIDIGNGDKIVGVQKEDKDILVGRDKNGAYFTIDKKYVSKSVSENAKKDNKNLLVTHNINESSLLKAEKGEGLIAPSLAIIKAEKGNVLKGYGNITLLGKKDLVDPLKRADTILHDSDIYTPRVPRETFDIDSKAWNKFVNKYRLDNMFSQKEVKYMKGEEGNKDRVLSMIGNDMRFKKEFLKEKGISLQDKMKIDRSSNLSDGYTKKMMLDAGITKKDLIELNKNDYENFSHKMTEFSDKMKNQIYKNNPKYKNLDNGVLKRLLANKGYHYNENGILNFGSADSLYRDMMNIMNNKKVLDIRETEKAIEKKFTKERTKEYEEWLNSELDEIFYNPTLKNGTMYTPRNIVDYMFKKGSVGTEEKGIFADSKNAGEIRAVASNIIKSIEEAKKKSYKLTSYDDMQPIQNEFTSRLFDLKENVDTKAIFNYAKNGSLSGIPQKYRAEVKEFVKDLREAKTQYFEAKLKRVVKVGEFKVAVVPKGTDKQVIDYLRKEGLKIKTYDSKLSEKGEEEIIKTAKSNNLLFMHPAAVGGGLAIGVISQNENNQ